VIDCEQLSFRQGRKKEFCERSERDGQGSLKTFYWCLRSMKTESGMIMWLVKSLIVDDFEINIWQILRHVNLHNFWQNQERWRPIPPVPSQIIAPVPLASFAIFFLTLWVVMISKTEGRKKTGWHNTQEIFSYNCHISLYLQTKRTRCLYVNIHFLEVHKGRQLELEPMQWARRAHRWKYKKSMISTVVEAMTSRSN